MGLLKSGSSIRNICLKDLFIILFFIFIFEISSLILCPLLLSEDATSLSISTLKYPYIYVNYKTKSSKSIIKEIRTDDKKITYYEISSIKSIQNNKLIPILLIQNDISMIDKSYDIKIMNFLLFIEKNIPNKENLIAFTFSSELNRLQNSILSVNFDGDKNIRLYDSLTILPNFLRDIKGYPIVIIIGVGENRSGISDRFLPYCPIVFVDVEDDFESKRDLNEFVKLSQGFSVNISDIKDYHKFEENIKKNLSYSSIIASFKAPSRFSFSPNHKITIKLSDGEEFSSYFKIGGFTILFPWIFTIIILAFIIYIFYLVIKKRNIENEKKVIFKPIFLGMLVVSSENAEKNIIISKNDFTIGSGEECELRINDFEISSLHCIIKRRKVCFEIIDLNSRNGTYVNNKRVSVKILKNGDVIKIGNTKMIFKISKIVENEDL